MGGRWARRLLWAGAAAALLLALGRYPPLRHPVDALLLAQALAAGEGESWLGRWTAPPRREAAYPPGGEADLYRPGAAPPRGCVLLAHGMTDLGRRDPRLAAFARILARLGFEVAAPELPGMRRFRPERGDVERIAAAFGWLAGRGPPGGPRCGMIAFSFAAGPALAAAAREELRRRVGYLVAVGGYFDLEAVLRHLTTGGRGEAPAFPGGPPVRAGKWFFLRYNAALLGLAGREAEVEAIVRRKLAAEDADVAPLAARLPEEARRVLALMENRDPARFDALYAAQPEALRARLAGWSMRGVLPRTRMPLYLLHGRADPFIPPSASRRLAEAARAAGGRTVRLLVTEGLGHVDPGAPRGVGAALSGLALVGFVSEVLVAMEGG